MDLTDVPQWDKDDDEKDFKEHMYGGRDGLICLIDATDPMFEVTANGECFFKDCIECCKTTMLNRIISSDKDLMGIVLYGTYKTENYLNVPNISVLQELGLPSAAKIKQLMDMLKRPNLNDFDTNFGHSQDFSLADALWLCQGLFSNSLFKLNSKSILLFTCVDHPHANDSSRQQRALLKAKDLCQVEIDLDLLHLGKNFNTSIFYEGLLRVIKGVTSPDWKLPDATTKLGELLERVNRIHYKKRSVGRLDFIIGKDVRCSVGIYNLVRETRIVSTIKLDRRTNESVKSSIRNVDEKGEVLLAAEVNKYQTFGNEIIAFTKEEVTRIRRITEPGLELIGFKPASSIKMHHYIRPSSFVYPEEKLCKDTCFGTHSSCDDYLSDCYENTLGYIRGAVNSNQIWVSLDETTDVTGRYLANVIVGVPSKDIPGSRKLMAALLERCLARRMVPISLYTPRRDATPKVVALVPQEEKLAANGTQIIPPGFHLIHLPYAENFRNVDTECTEVADANQVLMAKNMISKLRLRYSPYKFENPKLQTHWRSIEALALDYNETEPYQDLSKPVYEVVDEQLGQAAEYFKNSVYPPDYDPDGKVKPASKRTVKQEDVDKPKKVPKTVEVPTNIKEMATKGMVEKLKVDELKAYLKSEDIKIVGLKKAELVDRVYKHLGIQQP